MSPHTDYASLNPEEFDPLEVHPDQEPNSEDSPSVGSAKEPVGWRRQGSAFEYLQDLLEISIAISFLGKSDRILTSNEIPN